MFKKTPSVSVLMPAFNAGQYLKLAVESILNQTYADFELIIVDDGSTDNSFDALIGFNDSRIKIIRNKQNLGLIATRNIAVSNARGPLVACLDADDIALPTRLKKQVEAFDADRDLALLGCQAYLLDEQGRKFGVVDVPTSDEKIRRTIFRHNNMIHSGVMMRRGVLNAVGDYPRDFALAEDYALWLRLIINHKVMNLPERLVQYRVHKRQVSQTKIQMMRQAARSIQSQAWEEFVNSGKSDGVLPPLSPSLWDELRGGEGTMGQDYVFWGRLYRQMGCWHDALRIVARGLISAPLCLELYAVLLPNRFLAMCKRIRLRVSQPE